MSYQGQDPNQQGEYPNSGQYSGGYTPPQQPTDPYSGQQYGQQGNYQSGGNNPGQQQYGQPDYNQQQYGQQGNYQQPYGQPGGYQQYGAAPAPGSTSMGLSQNVASGLSYVLGWITGIIFFLMEKQNRFVRFHAMQSILFFGGLSVLSILLGIIGGLSIPFVSTLAAFVSGLLGLVWLVGWIVLMINGFQGKYFKLPVIGDYAERYANQINL